MNNSNLLALMSQTRDYQLHRRKLMGIMTKNPSVLDSKRQKVINKFYTSKDKAKQYSFKSKQQAMERQNDLILKKIINVSNRKNQNQLPNRNLSHNNLLNLKKSAQLIHQENNKIAQKLVQTQSKLAQEVVGSTYKKHLQFKGRITKYSFDQDYGGIIPKKFKSLTKLKKLDPLRYDESLKLKQEDNSKIIENQQN